MTIDKKVNEPSVFQKTFPKTSQYLIGIKELFYEEQKPEPVYREITQVQLLPWNSDKDDNYEPSEEVLQQIMEDHIKLKKEMSLYGQLKKFFEPVFKY
ncbi:hypothetical protein C0585_05105 [Candidatus Woesearchaeota archaeon]|nr:MAG: hypothetical protein C0585_05105 [Candidatus Woesearchaeota archaeon]